MQSSIFRNHFIDTQVYNLCIILLLRLLQIENCVDSTFYCDTIIKETNLLIKLLSTQRESNSPLQLGKLS